ncbi:MAG: hypothetical protein HWN67_14190 [Candidatus Helarchaeota archaeon]|nr:hypothetical protein [Candidatus Helarchaeota archaeon]
MDKKIKKYSEIFNRIINQIALLKDEYPHFSEIEPIENKISKSSDPFEISFLYSHHMDLVDNPRWKPRMKIPKKILAPTSEDGIYIWIRFMEKGKYMSQRVLPPTYIGDIHVTVDILGGNSEVKEKIWSIIKSENLTIEK